MRVLPQEFAVGYGFISTALSPCDSWGRADFGVVGGGEDAAVQPRRGRQT